MSWLKEDLSAEINPSKLNETIEALIKNKIAVVERNTKITILILISLNI